MQLRRYLFNALVSLDQLANTLTGGDPDETISSRCGKLREKCKFCRLLCGVLDWIDPGHTDRAIEKDEGAGSL